MFVKFPEIIYQGRKLVWDSRQPEDQIPEWVFLFDDAYTSQEVLNQLHQRANAKFVGPVGSGADIEVRNPRNLLGEWASLGLECPSSKLKVFGVTGTNGKTTSTALMRGCLLALGQKVCEIGTLGVQFWDPKHPQEPTKKFDSGFTTPEAPQLHSIFRSALNEGYENIVMESSSHASVLGRVAGVDFDTMLFTNLTQDHLDFHKTMDAYGEAKLKLFTDYLPFHVSPESGLNASKKKKFAIVNESIGGATFDLAREAKAKIPTQVFRVFFDPDKQITNLRCEAEGMNFDFVGDVKTNRVFSCRLPLIGDFNAGNFLGAFLSIASVYPDLRDLNFAEFPKFFSGVAGRMQLVEPGSRVWIDFAHTPDALEKSLSVMRSSLEHSTEVWVVFGCGGDRDRNKRPIMGEIAVRLADRVVVTSDNPRTEDPEAIIQEICSGISSESLGKVKVVVDRSEAIRFAINSKSPNAGVLIAGKGHEDYQIIGNHKLPFSDLLVARNSLKVPTP